MITMLVGHLCMYLLPSMLLLGIALIACSFGGIFAIMPVIIAELFGTENFGTNWGILVLAPGSSSFLLGYLFGRIYDSHATVVDAGTGDAQCHGTACYRDIFLVTVGLLVIGCVANWRVVRAHKSLADTSAVPP